MRKTVWVVGLSAVGAASALANGSMGLGLEQWDPANWLCYVAGMVVLEAWVIGLWLKFGWWKSLGVSLLANAFTGVGCGLGGCLAPFLHETFVGSRINPNPLLSAAALLALFAVPSAFLETFVWAIVSKRLNEPLGQPSLFMRVMRAHLVGVPVGLAILLVPPRPYIAMEIRARAARASERRSFQQELQDFVWTHGHWPKAKTLDALLVEVEGKTGRAQERRLMFYLPEFRRFDTGEAWRHPFVLDASVAGRKVDPDADPGEERWYVYSPGDPLLRGGIRIDVRTGEVMDSAWRR